MINLSASVYPEKCRTIFLKVLSSLVGWVGDFFYFFYFFLIIYVNIFLCIWVYIHGDN